MDEHNLRGWGVAGAAIILAVAVAIALFAEESPAPGWQAAPPQMHAAAIAPIPGNAQAKGDPPILLIARFAQTHPLSNAQALDQQGRETEAQAAVKDVLRRRDELRAFCFVRFTVASEIVLTLCQPSAPALRERVAERARRQLEALAGVDYVDATIAAQGR
jgi:hypothetical protein